MLFLPERWQHFKERIDCLYVTVLTLLTNHFSTTLGRGSQTDVKGNPSLAEFKKRLDSWNSVSRIWSSWPGLEPGDRLYIRHLRWSGCVASGWRGSSWVCRISETVFNISCTLESSGESLKIPPTRPLLLAIKSKSPELPQYLFKAPRWFQHAAN